MTTGNDSSIFLHPLTLANYSRNSTKDAEKDVSDECAQGVRGFRGGWEGEGYEVLKFNDNVIFEILISVVWLNPPERPLYEILTYYFYENIWPDEKNCPARDMTQWHLWHENRPVRFEFRQEIRNLSYCPLHQLSFLRCTRTEPRQIRMGYVEGVVDATGWKGDLNPILFECPVCSHLHPLHFLQIDAREHKQSIRATAFYPFLGNCSKLSPTVSCRYKNRLRDRKNRCSDPWRHCIIGSRQHWFTPLNRIDRIPRSNIFAYDEELENRYLSNVRDTHKYL